MTNVVRIPNAYDQGRAIEARGVARLRPWLSKAGHEGRWVWIARNGLAKLMQTAGADIIIASSATEEWALDCKFIEWASSYDAPFERWSNLRLMPDFTAKDFEQSGYSAHMIDSRASKPGWGVTSKSDLILVYNLSSDRGLIGRLDAWRSLLNERLPSGLRQWHAYKLREQRKRQQPNSSWCIWTPPSALVQRAGFQSFNAQQLGFWDQPELTLTLAASRAEIGA